MKFSRKVVAVAVVSALSTAAFAAKPADAGNGQEKIRVIMVAKPGNSVAAEHAIHAAGGQIKHQIFGMEGAWSVEVAVPALEGLEHNPHFETVEEDVKRYPMAASTLPPGTAEQKPYGITMVQADHADFAGWNASNRKICIIDSGYDGQHEDLKHDASVTGEYDSGSGWWYVDTNHHGTHVAGTIAGLDNNVGVVGVVPSVKLHIVKVFDEAGWAYSSSLTTAANKCKAAGANVISMSLGGGRASKTEQRAFDSLLSGGILSIAAAGNDGNTTMSYPASYSSVMSVAAIDENKAWATFSQYNSQVEIAAPGVAVWSTVPRYDAPISSLSVGGVAYDAGSMEGSPAKTATAALFDFGIGNAVNTGAAGKVCLIQRGTVDFATKVSNCQNSGGVGAIVYNNVAGSFGGTLGTTVTNIPSVTATDTDGAAMKNQIGQSATVTVGLAPANYEHYDGTSMATPHVSAVAALVWSFKPTCTAAQVRAVLQKTAQDLGPVGRDTKFGYGLVQAKAAKDKLMLNCGI